MIKSSLTISFVGNRHLFFEDEKADEAMSAIRMNKYGHFTIFPFTNSKWSPEETVEEEETIIYMHHITHIQYVKWSE